MCDDFGSLYLYIIVEKPLNKDVLLKKKSFGKNRFQIGPK